MRVVKRSCLYLALLLLVISMTGCWDRKEIEDVGIVLGIGFDEPSKNMTEREKNGSIDGKKGKRQAISMIHQLAIPKQFAAKEAGISQKDYINLISEGTSVFENIRELSTRAERSPSYEHLRIIVISETIARNIDLNNLINFLLRNTETRRSIRVVISQGKAEDAFEKSGIVRNPALVLRELADNYQKTLSMANEFKLGDMSEKITGKTSFIVPRVDTTKKEAKIAGAAVIKGKTAKMIGWLGEKEIVGLNLLKGEKKNSGIISGSDPKSGETIVYEIRTVKSKIKPQVKGDKLSFAVEIHSEGKLREDWVDPGNAFDQEFIKRAEQATEVSIQELVEKVLTRTQNDFKVDVIGFGKKLSINYPQIWKKMKEDWDDEFSGVEVEVKVKVKIQEFGTRGTKKG
ncbi:Ger(x)C family spore germination protein [Paenibacillus sp. LMG 31460]|uniref:Ger(X)C family spore germination protein n=1 Tax=Paenibacillus germinis TaxID=2654979 RepID=A0ABX1Z0M4_9BACL|nr:Ger(x)C family spore germination protein [Paenibacillus germinis]NOU85508.1 Ger(x)C family spore germination protein [Paenibacillus germinis]